MANSKTLKPFTHVVFDLDGTLIDTESIFNDAINKVTSLYGYELTREDRIKQIGITLRNVARLIVRNLKSPLTEQQFYVEVRSELKELMKNGVKFMPGAEEIVKKFHYNNFPIGICTASTHEMFNVNVSHFGDFFTPEKYFHLFVCAGSDPEITHNKPDPEPYMVTIKRLPGNPKPENVLVFEDSLNGMKSAKAAGAQCVLIPDSRVDFGNAASEATLVIKSFNDFDPTLFGLPPFK